MMKNIALLICILLISNLSFAKEKPTVNLNHDPFVVFYPHLENSMCRKIAFGVVSDKNLDEEKKIKAWNSHENLCSKDGTYQLILAALYASNQNYKAAKKILEDSIQNVSYDTKYHKSHLHEIYVNLGEIDRSIDLATTIIKNYPDFYHGYVSLAINCCIVKDWINAKKCMEKAISLNVKDSYSYRLLSRIAYELKEYDKVYSYYEKAFLIDPFITLLDRSSSFSMIASLIHDKNFEEAKNFINDQLDADPKIKYDDRFIDLQKLYEIELKKADKNIKHDK
jgi:tetratricopeptide (TPR) repeat protein